MAVISNDDRLRVRGSIWRLDLTDTRGLTVKAAYVALHHLDLVLTVFAGTLGLYEMNPFMRAMLESPLQLLLFKLMLPFIIAWLVPSRFLIPAGLLLLGVLIWNLKELILLAL
jgi:Domain of unknown function (DUF5658)